MSLHGNQIDIGTGRHLGSDERPSAGAERLRRALFDLAQRGLDQTSPLDLAPSLAAMAALLGDAAGAAASPPAGRGESDRQPVDAAAMATKHPSALPAPEAQRAARRELAQRLDALEQRLRSGRTAISPELVQAMRDLERGLAAPRSAPDASDRRAPFDLESEIRSLAALTRSLRERRKQSPTAPVKGASATHAGATRRDARNDDRAASGDSLAQGLDAFAKRVEAGLATAARELGALKLAIERLGERIDARQDGGEAPNSLLDHRLSAISRRVESAEQGFASIAALEGTIQRLLRQFDEQRAGGAPPAGPNLPPESAQHNVLQSAQQPLRKPAQERFEASLRATQQSIDEIFGRLARMEAEGDQKPNERAEEAATPDRGEATAADPGAVLIEPGGAFARRRGPRSANMTIEAAGGPKSTPHPGSEARIAPAAQSIPRPPRPDPRLKAAPAQLRPISGPRRAFVAAGVVIMCLGLAFLGGRAALTGADSSSADWRAFLQHVESVVLRRGGTESPASKSAGPAPASLGAQAQKHEAGEPGQAASGAASGPQTPQHAARTPTPPPGQRTPEATPAGTGLFDPAPAAATQATSAAARPESRVALEPGASPLTQFIGGEPALREGAGARFGASAAPPSSRLEAVGE